jgi:hypothetical protein
MTPKEERIFKAYGGEVKNPNPKLVLTCSYCSRTTVADKDNKMLKVYGSTAEFTCSWCGYTVLASRMEEKVMDLKDAKPIGVMPNVIHGRP